MIDAIIAVFAIIILASAAIVGAVMVAVDNVKSYLMDALADIPNREQITIIA